MNLREVSNLISPCAYSPPPMSCPQQFLLWSGKRTLLRCAGMSAYDPKRTSPVIRLTGTMEYQPGSLRLDVGGDHKIVPFGKVHHDPLCQIGTRYPDRFQTER